VILTGPVLEEMLFRGVFQESLQRWFKHWIVIVVVALVAAVGHGPGFFWHHLLSQLVFGVTYSISGRSLPCTIMVHGISNGILYFFL